MPIEHAYSSLSHTCMHITFGDFFRFTAYRCAWSMDWLLFTWWCFDCDGLRDYGSWCSLKAAKNWTMIFVLSGSLLLVNQNAYYIFLSPFSNDSEWEEEHLGQWEMQDPLTVVTNISDENFPGTWQCLQVFLSGCLQPHQPPPVRGLGQLFCHLRGKTHGKNSLPSTCHIL